MSELLKKELVTIRLFDGDKKRLEEYYPSVGYNRVIRTLVRKHIKSLDEKFSQRLSKEEFVDDDRE